MLKTLLSCVTASVMWRKRIAQSPLAWVINSMGLAPRFYFHARQPSAANGSKADQERLCLVHLLTTILATI
jgi:hypothetical protein